MVLKFDDALVLVVKVERNTDACGCVPVCSLIDLNVQSDSAKREHLLCPDLWKQNKNKGSSGNKTLISYLIEAPYKDGRSN